MAELTSIRVSSASSGATKLIGPSIFGGDWQYGMRLVGDSTSYGLLRRAPLSNDPDLSLREPDLSRRLAGGWSWGSEEGELPYGTIMFPLGLGARCIGRPGEGTMGGGGHH